MIKKMSTKHWSEHKNRSLSWVFKGLNQCVHIVPSPYSLPLTRNKWKLMEIWGNLYFQYCVCSRAYLRNWTVLHGTTLKRRWNGPEISLWIYLVVVLWSEMWKVSAYSWFLRFSPKIGGAPIISNPTVFQHRSPKAELAVLRDWRRQAHSS